MGFTSISFLIFAAAVAGVYFLTPRKHQWIVLLIASYVFYLISAKALVGFLLLTTISTFFTGQQLGKENGRYRQLLADASGGLEKEQKKQLSAQHKKKKSTIVLIALLVNFGILAFLKYFNFTAVNLNSIFSLLSMNASLPVLNLILPLGISFYTFQSAGYVIDVYRGKIQPDTNIAKFALFVSFFPQIVQGPIARFSDLAHQLYEGHAFDYTRVKYGIQLVLWGAFKKMVIADRAAFIVDEVFQNYTQYEGFTIFIGAVLYTIQIYCDFSGGIDIARGIAQILGITLTNNFERPLFATSIDNFWRRWHITLGSWTRDYIFYPLSLSKASAKLGKFSRKLFGNDFGKLVPIFASMLITFLVVGIWHGPSWKFIAYGLYNGFFISLGILMEPLTPKITAKLHIKTNCFSWRFFQILTTFLLVCVGRYFSRAGSFMSALRMLKRTVSVFNPWVFLDGTMLNLGLDQAEWSLLLISIGVLLVADLLQEKGVAIREKLAEQNLVFRWAIYLAAIFAILIFGIYGLKYNASDFIYMGF